MIKNTYVKEGERSYNSILLLYSNSEKQVVRKQYQYNFVDAAQLDTVKYNNMYQEY